MNYKEALNMSLSSESYVSNEGWFKRLETIFSKDKMDEMGVLKHAFRIINWSTRWIKSTTFNITGTNRSFILDWYLEKVKGELDDYKQFKDQFDKMVNKTQNYK